MGYEQNDIFISIDSTIGAHTGIGSNVSQNTALLCGLNHMFGSIFSTEELYEILTSNYVEASHDGTVRFGFNTGLGEASLLHGGFVVIDEVGMFQGSLAVDGVQAIVALAKMEHLAKPEYLEKNILATGLSGDLEVSAIAYGLQTHQKKFGSQCKDVLTKQIIPCIKNKAFHDLMPILNDLNSFGSFERMKERYDGNLMDAFVGSGLRLGAFYGGMSSAGPAMFLLTERDRSVSIVNQLADRFHSSFQEFSISDIGHRLRIKDQIND